MLGKERQQLVRATLMLEGRGDLGCQVLLQLPWTEGLLALPSEWDSEHVMVIAAMTRGRTAALVVGITALPLLLSCLPLLIASGQMEQPLQGADPPPFPGLRGLRQLPFDQPLGRRQGICRCGAPLAQGLRLPGHQARQLREQPSVVAQLPRHAKPVQMTSEPFTHTDVVLNGGWLYNSGSSHRGLDYSRSNVPAGADPTFAVRAMADGIVRKVIPLNPNSPRGGNVVIIEHTVPGKPSTFSLYFHLRNGKTADRAAVQTVAATCPGYAIWATLNPNHVTWGTDAQAIMVRGRLRAARPADRLGRQHRLQRRRPGHRQPRQQQQRDGQHPPARLNKRACC